MAALAPRQDPRQDPRWSLFEKALDRELNRWNRLRLDAEEDVSRLVAKALRAVQARLEGPLSDWQAHHLPQLERQLGRVLAELAEDLGATVAEAAGGAWAAGQALVDVPLGAAGLGQVTASLPRLDGAQLRAVRTILTGRMAGVVQRSAERINAQLAFVAMGTRDPGRAVTEITAILGESTRKRALVVTRTELGRVWSTAAQERQSQAREALPGLRKQWRRSGKIHSRRSHDLADGQVVDVNEPFLVGGIQIMHPRHPDAPAEHSINCGCLSLPYMASWEMRTPGRQPVSDAERAGSAAKRDLEEINDAEFRRWAGWLAEGREKPKGWSEPVALLPGDVVTRLAARGVSLVSPEVAVSDRRLAHMMREQKPNKLPAASLRGLPALMAKAEAVYFAGTKKGRGQLVYVVPVPGQPDKAGRLFVTLRHDEAKARPRRHNYVVSGDLVDRQTIAGAVKGGDYETLLGAEG